MEIHTKKAECMVITKSQSIPMFERKIDGITLNQVEKFKCLESWITSDARCHKDVRTRIAMAKQSFNTLDNILRSKNRSMSVRTRVLKCYVWPVLLYGCESWTLTTALIKNLEAAEMWFYRKMQRISYMAKKANKQVLVQINQDKSLFTTIKKRQFEFFWTHYQVKTTRTFGCLWKKLRQERPRTSRKNVPGPTQGLAEFKHSTYLAASL